MNKRIIYLILVIICLITIFIFSSKNSNESNGFSKGLINKVVIVYEKITNIDVDNTKIVKDLNYPIRKCAHFTIFLILGIFVYLYISSFNVSHKVLISILICLICASLDETHQLFTGRTTKLLDVLIDTIGASTSILVLNYKTKNKDS